MAGFSIHFILKSMDFTTHKFFICFVRDTKSTVMGPECVELARGNQNLRQY